MTRDEATAALALLVAEYGDQIPEARAALVLEELLRFDPEVGIEAARRMVRSERWFSTAALVGLLELVAYERERERELSPNPDRAPGSMRALPPVPADLLSPEEIAARARELRRRLAGKGAMGELVAGALQREAADG